MFALYGSDGLFYSGTVQAVLRETREFHVEFTSVPGGDGVVKVVPEKDISGRHAP